ncbi:hypothetical protein Q604_UNBC03315G0001, partial [human gut metagenome]
MIEHIELPRSNTLVLMAMTQEESILICGVPYIPIIPKAYRPALQTGILHSSIGKNRGMEIRNR